ncbi:MAG TPA: DegT/DnrJ/EryC1/StrS aminotransferase family protein [Alphaproteobacteria bacterium]|nr:DegT/DnrJ/EryC1/StrS aminotransferase family protein [Alphaproteobacteria bacterium]
MRTTYLPYYRPQLDDREIEAAVECLRNGWLTSGSKAGEFEEAFASACGVEHAVAMNSCTAALHVALCAMDVGAGDEVVMPSLTFVAGAQCTLELGATPVFADVDPGTLSVTVESIDAVVTPRTKVIIAMPYAGRPLDICAIVEYAHSRGIRVLEDAAHAAGMLHRGEWSGARSDAAAYSFYATKNLTSAEGGMLVTRDARIAERARILRLHGMSKDAWKRYTAGGSWRYDVVAPGFKYNLPDPLAAIGLAQLERLEALQQRRTLLAQRYVQGLSDVEGLELQRSPSFEGDRHSWCMFVIRVDAAIADMDRDGLIEGLKAANIGTSVHYVPTHLLSAYRTLARRPLVHTEAVWQQLVSLPLFPAMSDEDVDDVVTAVRSIARQSMFQEAAS